MPFTKEQAAEYRAKNRERAAARAREWYAKNKERAAATQRERRSRPEVQERIREYFKAWAADNRERDTGIPIPEYWPYLAGDTHGGWPVDDVNAIVPKNMPAEVRADVCQELCLVAVEGGDIAQHLRYAMRRAWGDYALSIDWRREDGLAIADQLAYEQYV